MSSTLYAQHGSSPTYKAIFLCDMVSMLVYTCLVMLVDCWYVRLIWAPILMVVTHCLVRAASAQAQHSVGGKPVSNKSKPQVVTLWYWKRHRSQNTTAERPLAAFARIYLQQQHLWSRLGDAWALPKWCTCSCKRGIPGRWWLRAFRRGVVGWWQCLRLWCW